MINASWTPPSHPEPVVRSFGDFARRYDGAGVRPRDDVWPWALAHLEEELLASGAEYLSLAVVDALVLPPPLGETHLHWQTAGYWLAALAGAGELAISHQDVHAARLRALEICQTCGPHQLAAPWATLADAVELAVNLLYRPRADVEALVSAELAGRADGVGAHPLIVALAERHLDRGGELVLIEDTMLSASQLREILLPTVGGRLAEAPIFASAEAGLTKANGSIFDYAAAQLNPAARTFFHIGADLNADFVRPRLFGWNAFHLPVPTAEENARARDEAGFNAPARASAEPALR